MINIKTLKFTIPMYGNSRCIPYGTLSVSDGEITKIVKIKDDGPRQYFTFKRKRYYVKRKGPLYNSYWELEKNE